MNKKLAVISSVIMSAFTPCVCFAAQSGGGGFSFTKILAIVLIIVFIITSIAMIICGKKMK